MLRRFSISIVSACCTFLWFLPWTVPIDYRYIYLVLCLICLVFQLVLAIFVATNKARHIHNKISVIISLIIASAFSISPIGYLVSYLWFLIAWVILIILTVLIIRNIFLGNHWRYYVFSAISILLYYTIVSITGFYGLEPIMP